MKNLPSPRRRRGAHASSRRVREDQSTPLGLFPRESTTKDPTPPGRRRRRRPPPSRDRTNANAMHRKYSYLASASERTVNLAHCLNSRCFTTRCVESTRAEDPPRARTRRAGPPVAENSICPIIRRRKETSHYDGALSNREFYHFKVNLCNQTQYYNILRSIYLKK